MMRVYGQLGLVVMAWVIGGSLAWAATGVTVNRVWPDKLVYGFAAPGTIAVTVSNADNAPRSARLRVILGSRLDREDTVYDEPLDLTAGETKEVTVPFTTGKKAEGAEYGYEARAVLSVEGQPDSSAREFFMVTDSPLKIGHLTITTAATDHRHDWWGESVKRGAQRMREQYFCMAETPFWAPCDFSELTTEREFWTSGQAGRFDSLQGMQEMSDTVHALGGWIVIYADKWAVGPVGFEHARQHPDWYHWGQDWYGCKFDVEVLDWTEEESLQDGKWKEQRDGGIWAICPLIAKPEVAEFGLSQIVGSLKQFGWDGIRFDNAGWYVDDVKDIHGEPAVKPGTDIPKLEADLVRRIRTDGEKAVAHFIYGDNVGWHTDITQASPKWRAEAARGGLVMYEGMNEITQPGGRLNNWAFLRDYLRQAIPTVRQAGGFPYGIVGIAGDRTHAATPATPRPENCILYGVLMGAGMHLCYAASPDYWPYMRLYARYCGLLYDDTLQFISDSPKMLTVTGPGEIWWQEYVRRRDLPDKSTQIIVHLINPSTGERYDEKNAVPAPQQNVTVRLAPPAGVTITRALALTADGADGPMSTPLPLAPVEGGLTVTVPELQYWTVVVFEGRR